MDHERRYATTFSETDCYPALKRRAKIMLTLRVAKPLRY
jgi:hypothetical protein